MKLPIFFSLLMLFIAPAVIAADPPATDLRHMNVGLLPLDQWRTDAVSVENGKAQSLTLTLHDKPFGSASPQIRYNLTPQSRVAAEISQIRGRLAIQCEWFDVKGQFLGATNGPELDKPQPISIDVSDILAKTDYKDSARSFGIKLWLGGESASATLSNFTFITAVTWKHKVGHIHRYAPPAPVEKDRGMQVETIESAGWILRLDTDAPASAIVLKDHMPYDKRGVVLLDLAMIDQGDVTIQALCWDKDGNFISSVNLLQSAATAGLYELPLSLYADQFPAQAQQISFKIWMGGKKPTAMVEQLLYATIED